MVEIGACIEPLEQLPDTSEQYARYGLAIRQRNAFEQQQIR